MPVSSSWSEFHSSSAWKLPNIFIRISSFNYKLRNQVNILRLGVHSLPASRFHILSFLVSCERYRRKNFFRFHLCRGIMWTGTKFCSFCIGLYIDSFFRFLERRYYALVIICSNSVLVNISQKCTKCQHCTDEEKLVDKQETQPASYLANSSDFVSSIKF